MVTQIFGSWKSKQSYSRIPQEYFDVAAVNKSFETADKANAYFNSRLNLKLRDDNPDYAAFTLGNFMLGGGFLNSRLATRIRGKDGLSYSIRSEISVSSLDESGIFIAYAIFAPQNLAKFETAFKEEINRVVEDGFTTEEIAKAKSGWLLAQQVNRGADNRIALSLANDLFTNRTFAWQDQLEKNIQNLTPEKINAAMKKYLTPDKISIFKAGDFAKAKTQ